MKSNYQHIFTPLTVKNMTIKNRIVMMPMGTNYGEQNGEMSFLHINYYKERAKGGTGLIIVENASVDSPQVPTELLSFVLTTTTICRVCTNSVKRSTNMVPVLQSRSTTQVLPLFPHVQICSRFPHLMFRPKKAEKSRVRYQWKKSITL